MMPPSPSVLVVDGLSEILGLFPTLIHRAMPGARVVVEADSRMALLRIEKEAFDIVVADLRMSHVNGLELLNFARSRRPDARRVLMSGHHEPIVNEAFLRLYDLDAFIQKPFDVGEVARLLDMLAASQERRFVVLCADGEPAMMS